MGDIDVGDGDSMSAQTLSERQVKMELTLLARESIPGRGRLEPNDWNGEGDVKIK